MSFSFQRTEAKKDEEELPAREGDPLLPACGRGTRPDSTASFVENNNSNTNPANRINSGSLRIRRASRSPTQEQTLGGVTPQSQLAYHSSTFFSQQKQQLQGDKTKTRQPVISSQMINADDESSTTSSAIFYAAEAASESAAAAQNNVDQAKRYIDFTDFNNNAENQRSGLQLPGSLASGTHQSDDVSHQRHQLLSPSKHEQQQQHPHHSSMAPNPGMPPYEPQPFRPPSPDEGRTDARSTGSGSQSQPPLLEIPEEIYAVRKAALKVLKPLTKTWIVISVGFSLTALFGAARWTLLLPTVPYWFILLPCWSSHVGLLWLHVLSAKALSNFIAEANDGRQRPDSRDHLNRTEYLPLLQRSLKFGLKTGILSFFVFIFEILIFIRLARGSITLTSAFVPLWVLVAGGIFDGLVCKTQHFLRVLCWMLSFTAMTLLVLKVDYGYEEIRWRVVVCPVVAVLSVASGSLIYIVYGHQIGFYRLTDSQLTAGNLYAIAALICIVLVFIIGEVIPLSRPVEVETKLFIVVLAPLVVCLTGMGAWVVSRDEFSRLLLYGGQSAVHPKKLRWVPRDGWTCVQGKGVTVIPMFGEVNFRPLERKSSLKSTTLELCVCCNGRGCCYPYEEEDEEDVVAPTTYHPYLDSNLPSRGNRNPHSYNTLRGL